MTDHSALVWTAMATIATAVAGFISAWIAYFAIKRQTQQTQAALGADLSLKLEERFNSEEFHRIRARAARALLEGTNLGEPEDVFDFFETVGLLVRIKTLSADLAYNFFFHWINLYWLAGENYIKTKRQSTKALWEDFEKLYQAVRKIEQLKDSSSSELKLGSEQIKERLKEELSDERH